MQEVRILVEEAVDGMSREVHSTATCDQLGMIDQQAHVDLPCAAERFLICTGTYKECTRNTEPNEEGA
jgi:hypothetical protein